ncbi:MAG TPA: transferrin receptor-like dimerization domain-containing protein [Rhodanobacteraceae bacterium]|nr:transferrin receptor-like dimerization domain-containing protein [Rhodanobacteraceae bacterium]
MAGLKRFAGLSASCLLFAMVGAVTASPAAPMASGDSAGMLGFTDSGATQQRSLEKRFDSMLSASEMRGWLKRLSSEPNQVGSPHDKVNAEWMLAQFKQWGWDAHIEKFDVFYPTPKQELVELVAPTHFKAKLHEPPLKGDRTSSLSGALPPYNVYGADGDVTGELVYVNYGMPDDYKELERLGISVKGKIVIVRYGGGWRGLKPELAYQHGAIGCLIYSDPRNDGYFNGDPYPEGATRPPQGVQRGSVAKMQLYPGDPTTPGYGSVPGAKHLPLKDARTLLKIPVLPISYADATPLLKAMGGPVAPENWRGALPFTYHVGAGPARVHMIVKSNRNLKTIYDVIAKLPGSSDADQWVLRGNHHDGWVFGAFDPLAGMVAEMDEAKALGTLYKQGWRPKRTIVYASWDGEEPGLLGSTEWAETHAKELQQKAVVYVNSDTNGRGFLSAGGSHSLQHLVNQVAAGVTDPETKVSVQQRQRARLNVRAARGHGNSMSGQMAKRAGKGGDIPISPLGSGSDYSTFLQHLGIATLDLGFGGESDQGGVYHSRYDSFDHFIRFGDPTFDYEVALAEVAGHIVMRTADAEVLPMRFGDFSNTLDRYVKQMHKEAKSERKAAEQQHKLLAAGDYKLASDPKHPMAPPARLSDVPKIDFGPLDAAAKKLKDSAQAYEKAYNARAEKGLDIPASQLRQVNQLMGTLEQRLLDQTGLPGRPWYKNMVQAPGELTGYAPKIIPAVHEALDARDWKRADKYAGVTAKVIDNYRAQLDKLTALLK